MPKPPSGRLYKKTFGNVQTMKAQERILGFLKYARDQDFENTDNELFSILTHCVAKLWKEFINVFL